MAHLRYIDDGGHLLTKTLSVDPIVIGRGSTCQLVLVSDMISREHARIELADEGRYRVRDLGSRNKTYVCGQLVTETLLTGGDILRLGDRVLEFIDDNAKRDRIELDFLTPDRKEPADCEWIKTKAPLSLTVSQLESLSRLPSQLSLTSRPEDVAETALAQVLLDLRAERGFVALRGEGKRELRPIAQRSLKKPPGGSLTPVSESFVFAPVLQSVAGRYPQSSSSIDPKSGYAATALVAPLTYRGDILGLIYVDRPTSKQPFASSALQQIAATGAQLGATMAESSRRLVEAASREGAAWMSTIRRLQGLLVATPAGTDAFEVGTLSYPGRARCGDLCDVVHVDEQRCAAVVVDAGGQGVGGLAQGASIRAAIRAALAVSEEALMEPDAMFTAINQMVVSSSARQVVPCTYLGIDLSAGRVSYINAGGMPPLLMVGPGRLMTLDQPSLILGVDAEYAYETAQVDLPETFRLMCYTDGLAEATNSAGESLGNPRVHEALLEQDAFAGVDQLLDKVKKLWKGHLAGIEPDDDATVLVISRG